MGTSDRRITPRFKLHTPLSFRRMEALAEGAQRAKAINISTRGVYFITHLALHVGEAVELLLEMPKRVTGAKSSSRRFTGRVTHVESQNMPQGLSGIGVQLLYYERDLLRVENEEL
jgi:PilZ domain